MAEDMFDWYQDYYSAVEKSKIYSRYCNEVFGRDLSQQGFCDMDQITVMLEQLELKPGCEVLDIGCGNGKLIEYISDITGASGYGFDYSTAAIRHASARTKDKQNRLFFDEGSIGIKQYPSEKFDAVISIDTIYFANELKTALMDILQWIKPGGKLAIFYSVFRFDENTSLDKLLPDQTELANAFGELGISYRVTDFTRKHYQLMKRKKRIASGLKQAFEDENTMQLYQNAITESIEDNLSYEDFRKFSVRYLYLVQK